MFLLLCGVSILPLVTGYHAYICALMSTEELYLRQEDGFTVTCITAGATRACRFQNQLERRL